MTEIINLENIKFSSINNKFGYNPKTGKFYVNKAYTEFKDLIMYSVLGNMFYPPYEIYIEIETYLDIDNCLKAVLDGLEEGGVIDDDKNILSLKIKKTKIPKNKLGALRVYIQRYVEV